MATKNTRAARIQKVREAYVWVEDNCRASLQVYMPMCKREGVDDFYINGSLQQVREELDFVKYCARNSEEKGAQGCMEEAEALIAKVRADLGEALWARCTALHSKLYITL